MSVATPEIPILTAGDLRSAGVNARDRARMVEREELQKLHRGAFARPFWTPETDARERHRLVARGHLSALSDEAVVSHWSAAALHGLPFWNRDLESVHVTRSRSNGGRVTSGQHVWPAPLAAEDIALLDGVPVTSVARTVVDLARHSPLRVGVAVADAALAGGLDPDALDRTLRSSRRRPGMRTARRAVLMADGRAETVAESFSRVVLTELGFPPSHLQYDIVDEHGVFLGRSDFCWEEQRTLGEFDGKIKYDELVPESSTARAVVYAEKRREDAIRSLGWEFVRWSWSDLSHPQVIAAALRRAFARTAARQIPNR